MNANAPLKTVSMVISESCVTLNHANRRTDNKPREPR